jgi:hypothetical protein
VNKQTKLIAGITVVVLVAVGAILLMSKKPAKPQEVKAATESSAVTPMPTPTVIPITPAPTSKYSPAFRAMARAAFISGCKAKVGQQYGAACNCGADYLAAHYTDSQLEKIYVEYHSGNQVPSEVRTAYDACKDK